MGRLPGDPPAQRTFARQRTKHTLTPLSSATHGRGNTEAQGVAVRVEAKFHVHWRSSPPGSQHGGIPCSARLSGRSWPIFQPVRRDAGRMTRKRSRPQASGAGKWGFLEDARSVPTRRAAGHRARLRHPPPAWNDGSVPGLLSFWRRRAPQPPAARRRQVGGWFRARAECEKTARAGRT